MCVSDKRHYEAQAILELGFLLPQQLNHVPPYLAQHLQPNRSVHTGQNKRIHVMLMYVHARAHTQTHARLLGTGMASGLELIVRNTDFFPIQPTAHVPALQAIYVFSNCRLTFHTTQNNLLLVLLLDPSHPRDARS